MKVYQLGATVLFGSFFLCSVEWPVPEPTLTGLLFQDVWIELGRPETTNSYRSLE